MITNTNMCSNINNIHQDLLCHLEVDRRSVDVSTQFSALNTNTKRIDFVYTIIEDYDLYPAFIHDLKYDEDAIKLRQEGNLMFKHKKITEAIELYSRSALNAICNSEQLALAYANRSAALFEIGCFEECLEVSLSLVSHAAKN